MPEATLPQPVKFLDLTLPKLSAAEAVEIARREFGLTGEARQLYSERDANFHLRPADGGPGHVLKIANAVEDPAVVDLQTAGLRHIARADPGLPVPRVVLSRDGEAIAWVELDDGARHMARVYSFLPGKILETVPHKPALLADLGRFAAQLDKALAGFNHPAAAQEIPWDLRLLPRMAGHVEDIDGDGRRAMVRRVIDNFAAKAMPRLARLRSQVIHNDLNLHNVLVDPDVGVRVAGVIDFGDMVVGPLLFEPSIAAADIWIGKDDPLQASSTVIGAYHQVLPLREDEIGLVYDLLLARNAISVVICARRAKHNAEAPSYLESYYEPCMAALDQLLTVGRDKVTSAIRAACCQKS
jgi:Ser/Thr protein kinase RdoA (MazF antagonist)